jgi:hypothetical protein
VSYSRNDAPTYSPSPAVEQSVAGPVALSHPEAMDRFNVGKSLTFGFRAIEMAIEFGERIRGGTQSTSYAILGGTPSES